MTKPIILHIGEPIKYNHEFYEKDFLSRFDVIQNEDLDREAFKNALRSNKYGNISAVFRPHFQTGGEMGQWDDELISLLPSSVRIFASAGAGFNWADVDALGKRKIWYANGAGASDEAVSDTGLYMILSVFRNFTRAQLAARTADPEVFNEAHKSIAMISQNPKDHTLGIVGLGSISKKLAYKARMALGMDIHYYDVVQASKEEERSLGATFHASLDSLLKVADCVSLHTPLNKYTKDLIDARALSIMKPGSRIINTARGPVLNEDALVHALESGHISAAGLDVHYYEPQVSKKLAQMPQVTLTTHIAGGALNTRINFELNAMKNILRVVGPEGEFTREEPLTPVNAEAFHGG
ncbi:2-ketogluconate reductase [Lindgomyces ingoldianus]|uniref:2-ketogluconate reductase n=1 Tax=Lindgomyces ingoldianus TaxID=673940 RepID=A0ACB6RBW7_9PLEO|nr:2-ketogluconate reductase [Lindgomyces ingoldianus]KAF2475971.1 2-ketogluconate reductase [Lindgomyces ingoldianus]